MEEEKGPVCVTDGTGFIGSWLVMKLLQNGYTVRTTVRPDPECKRDISYLTSLPRASEKLHIFNGDLNQPESFNVAIEGCTGVFHVAHPMPNKELDEASVTKQSVEGTLGILKACLNAKTVKKVVYTSSAATVAYSGNNKDMADESSWSDIEYHRSLGLFRSSSYVAAKTKTEQAVLEFAEKNGLELVTLIPPFVLGGFICKDLPGSVELILSMILGKADNFTQLHKLSLVHVDDLVSAHIFLFENSNAKGRYICSSTPTSIDEMYRFLYAKYPEFRIPTTQSLKEAYKICGFSSKKLLNTGFTFKHGLDDILTGAFQSCREKGFLERFFGKMDT
ncbi:putative vestitone reductase [Rosa chinensis]|uniref:Putative vestitone reductase n=1 Tax=Rosa chinensis TaxID=74649 RepID=A0A2P6SG17_ROSCH|nr:vestitone reductase [Rosa chinensis]XP_040368795.1 vestitone reductase [Rosa chinensis]XP_040368796.1 vestitone reductase [Rosa chinensis]PRQ57620.1 putative vestitone reductase [Rosa chinensis]